MDFHPEVPAHVQYQRSVQNGVVVLGGTNWDLSRSAIATPIVPAPLPAPAVHEEVASSTPYSPSHRMPMRAPDILVTFDAGKAQVRPAHQAKLRAIPRGTTIVLAGHADPDEKNAKALARQRAQAVAAYLRRNARPVEAVRSFGADLPVAQGLLNAKDNRRVEVFLGQR